MSESMNNQEITRKFLELLSAYWDDPAVHRGFEELKNLASCPDVWRQIIGARLLALQNKTQEAVDLLEEIMNRGTEYHSASLLLIRTMTRDTHNFWKALDLLEDLLNRGFEGQVAQEWFEIMALGEKIYTLIKEKKLDEAIETADQLLYRFNGYQDPFLAQQVARALVSKGYAHIMQDNPEEAIRICNEVENRFGHAAEPGIREMVARALVNKGFAIGQQGNPEEAIRIYNEIENRFSDETEPGIREAVAVSLVNKGFALWQQGKLEEEIWIYNEVVNRFGDAAEPGIREQVAMAMVNKGVAIGKLGNPEEEIRIYNEVVYRFGDASKSGIREQVARAMVYKGIARGDQGKHEASIQIYEEVEKRFGESHNPLLRKWIFEARLRKSLSLLEVKRDDEARKIFKSVQSALLKEDKLKKELTYLYARVARRFSSEMPPEKEDQRESRIERDLEITSGDAAANLQMILSYMLKEIDKETQKNYFDNMEAAQKRTDRFITENSHFSDDLSFLLVLREWNSYTPVIPAGEERDRGGGYYIRHAGEGIVIDPGYDFIENFHRAGGRLGGIDHIIVTHAHDDHTAELEALLMLFQRRCAKRNIPRKRLNLYLSAGVQRKFAGLLNLRDSKYGRLITLCPSTKDYEQRMQLNGKTTLTVLPAYHDDVITRDSAVGLGFEFDTENGVRKVVFTGDSGLYPRKRSPEGDELYYDEDGKSPMLETVPGSALFDQYPKAFAESPHLVVAHIGSIKEQEFGKGDIPTPEEAGRWFYPNHLGLLGTLMLLNKLHPKAAVVSEFGSELKGFHIELVEKLGQALNKVQENRNPDMQKTLVIPGDLSTAYAITNHRFLSHSLINEKEFQFVDMDKLVSRKAKDYLYQPRWKDEIEVSEKVDSQRAYLFVKDDSENKFMKLDGYYAKTYAKHFFGRRLPYQKNIVSSGDEL